MANRIQNVMKSSRREKKRSLKFSKMKIRWKQTTLDPWLENQQIQVWQSICALSRGRTWPCSISISFSTETLMSAAACPICSEDFSHEAKRVPKFLTCGHTYCSNCIKARTFIARNVWRLFIAPKKCKATFDCLFWTICNASQHPPRPARRTPESWSSSVSAAMSSSVRTA